MTVDSVHIYIQSLEKELAAGETTEHTHRPALKTLLESLNTAITATNEPQHITSVGAPDFRIIKNKLAIGYVECKDIDKNLDDVLETDQLTRYLHSFHNLLWKECKYRVSWSVSRTSSRFLSMSLHST